MSDAVTTPDASSATGARPRAFAALDPLVARALLTLIGARSLDLVLHDGRVVSSGATPADMRLTFKTPSALWRVLANPEFQFGELYTRGEIVVEGDLTSFLEGTYAAMRASILRRWKWPWWMRRDYWGQSWRSAREDIHHHYDIGNEFYALWLDPTLTYTCAYFAEPGYSLEAAQLAKLEHVARKLRLAPGERVLELGSGWGALALYMAKHHGVKVRSYNLSHEQVVYARELAAREGLSSSVEFVEDDFRSATGQYDALVSVGMLEHVGPKKYRQVGSVMDRCLTRQGRGLIHAIGRNRPSAPNQWLHRRIFPGGYAPALRELVSVFEPHGFSVLDVENLRLHYAKTVEEWLRRFEASLDRIRDMFDEPFIRAWRLYLAASTASFRVGGHQLFQIVFAREQHNEIPWTRADIYRTSPESGAAQ